MKFKGRKTNHKFTNNKNLKIESSDIIYKLNKKVSNLKEENKILKLHIANNFSSNKMNRKISLQKKRKTIIDLQKMKNIYCWSDNYYKSNKKLFSQLYEYFLANYPEIKNDDLDIQQENFQEILKNPNNVEKFIKYRFNPKSSSFPNRVNKVKRLVKRLLGLNQYDFTNINVKESKKKGTSFLNEADISALFTALDKCNSKCLYIATIFLVLYGFSFRIISRLKKNNIHINEMTIDINYNKNRKRRKMNILVTQYILSYFKDKNLKNNDYIFFNEHTDCNEISREKYVSWRIINEINMTNFFIGRNSHLIIKEFHSIRKTIKIKEYLYFSKNFNNMEAEGKANFINEQDKNIIGGKSFLPMVTEREIGHEYPDINFKFIENNSLNFQENDYLEHFEPSFLDYNLIEDIKDEFFNCEMKYDISLYNNLSQSQIYYLDPKKKSSLIIPEFNYNPFFIDSNENKITCNIVDILNKLGIEFVDEPIFDNINDCRATFAKIGSHFPYLKFSNLTNYIEMKKNSIKSIYPWFNGNFVKKMNIF